MVTSSPLISAQAVSATSGCHGRLLLGFNVSHQRSDKRACSKNNPKLQRFSAKEDRGGDQNDYKQSRCRFTGFWKSK
jgi:hypothetical protein